MVSFGEMVPISTPSNMRQILLIYMLPTARNEPWPDIYKKVSLKKKKKKLLKELNSEVLIQ